MVFTVNLLSEKTHNQCRVAGLWVFSSLCGYLYSSEALVSV